MEPSPDHTPVPEEEEMLAEIRLSSRVSGYSDDTFESIGDGFSESVSRGSGYSNDSFESDSYGSSGKYEGESLSAEESYQPLSAETNDSKSEIIEVTSDNSSSGNDLILKWIDILKDRKVDKGANISAYRPKTVSVPTEKQTTNRDATEEGDALRNYCSKKIRRILQPQAGSWSKEHHQVKKSNGRRTGDQKCIVPYPLMNRLQLENTRETMKQLIKVKMHQPSTCLDCCRKQAELAKVEFLRIKKSKLEGHLLEKKMEELLYNKDLVTCIGEIHKSLPMLSDDPSTVWQRLYSSVMKT